MKKKILIIFLLLFFCWPTISIGDLTEDDKVLIKKYVDKFNLKIGDLNSKLDDLEDRIKKHKKETKKEFDEMHKLIKVLEDYVAKEKAKAKELEDKNEDN